MYNTKFYPSARFSSNFYRRYPSVSNDSLFAYILVLTKRIPNPSDKELFISEIAAAINEYKSDIDLMLIGFPINYVDILNNNK